MPLGVVPGCWGWKRKASELHNTGPLYGESVSDFWIPHLKGHNEIKVFQANATTSRTTNLLAMVYFLTEL